jgi:hypothetical protein
MASEGAAPRRQTFIIVSNGAIRDEEIMTQRSTMITLEETIARVNAIPENDKSGRYRQLQNGGEITKFMVNVLNVNPKQETVFDNIAIEPRAVVIVLEEPTPKPDRAFTLLGRSAIRLMRESTGTWTFFMDLRRCDRSKRGLNLVNIFPSLRTLLQEMNSARGFQRPVGDGEPRVFLFRERLIPWIPKGEFQQRRGNGMAASSVEASHFEISTTERFKELLAQAKQDKERRQRFQGESSGNRMIGNGAMGSGVNEQVEEEEVGQPIVNGLPEVPIASLVKEKAMKKKKKSEEAEVMEDGGNDGGNVQGLEQEEESADQGWEKEKKRREEEKKREEAKKKKDEERKEKREDVGGKRKKVTKKEGEGNTNKSISEEVDGDDVIDEN